MSKSLTQPVPALTACECPQAGFCVRHNCDKTARWWHLCRTREDYFRLWERGHGPGQRRNPPLESAPLRHGVMPEKPWEGNCRKKPWDYPITAAIPVLDTPDLLEMVIELLRWQSEPPFILVVDTGSRAENLEQIERLRADDVEVHCLRLNGVRHPSDFPAMAMDLAMTLCRSPYLFATHADCFLRKRTLLAELQEMCRTTSPVVGYELSPRKCKDWQGMVSHTCTMLDMTVMDQIGAGWSLRRLARAFGVEDYRPDPMRPSWPDTELLLNYLLRQQGITPHLIGHDENHVRQVDENIDHCRSLTSGLLYNETYYRQARAWADEALVEARDRIANWKAARSPAARRPSAGSESALINSPEPGGAP